MSLTQVPDIKPVQRRCPLLAAAERLGDDAVLDAVDRWHPWWRCPARRERAA